MRRISLLLVLASLSLAACHKKEDAPSGVTATPGDTGSGAAAAPAPAPKVADSTLTVTAKGRSVGDKSETRESSELEMELSKKMGAKTKETKLSMTESTTKKEEVLAVDGKTITKARVTYSEKKKSQVADGKERKRPASPIEGKTYVLEMKNGKLDITDEKGKKPSRREEDAVRRSNGDFGKPDPVLAAMPATPLEIGKKVDALSAALQELVQARDDGAERLEASDAEVKLASIEGTGPDAVGVFSVTLTLSSPKKSRSPVALKAPLTGTLKLRAKDGWVTGLTLSGPIELEPIAAAKNVSGKGSMKLAYEITY